MNTINLIIPYRYEGMWVFDDPRVGLDKEPFVSGADTMINVLVADPECSQRLSAAFFSNSFPGIQGEAGMGSRRVWRQLVFFTRV